MNYTNYIPPIFYKAFLFVILFAHFSFAQNQTENKIDSLKNQLSQTKSPQLKNQLLNSIAISYIYSFPSEGIVFAEEAIKISQKENLLKETAMSYETLGKLYLIQLNYEKSKQAFIQSAKIFHEIKALNSYWNVRRQIGQVHYEMGDYPKAISIYFDVLKYYEQTKNNIGKATVLNNIGVLFHRQNNIPKAIEYYQKGIQLLTQNKGIKGEIYCRLQTNMGLSYSSLQHYSKAKDCFLNSLKENEKIDNLYIYTINIGNLAATYAGLKDYSTSEKYFKEAIEKSKEMNNFQSIAVNYGDLGNLYLKIAEESKTLTDRKRFIKKAIHYLELALETLKSNEDFRRYQFFSQELSHAYELNHDYKNALRLFKEHAQYKDRVFNDEITNEMARREIGYEFSKREDSIRLQNEKQLAVRDALLTANKQHKLLLFSGIMLLCIVIALLFYQNNVRKKNNIRLSILNKELNEANLIKAKFFGILNHDLRSPISNIIKLIHLQQNDEIQLNKETMQRLEKQTIHSAEKLLASMEDLLLWSKGQMETFEPHFEMIEIEQLFIDLKTNFDSFNSIEINYLNPNKITINSDLNYLKTIMRNLTYNALNVLKENSKPQLIWSANEDQHHYILSITDNGYGGNKEQFRALYDEKYSIGIQSGLGLHLVRDMAKAIDCKIEVHSKLNEGTTISLFFPKKA